MAKKKEPNLNDPKERTKYWTEFATDRLLGKTITRVEYFSSSEAKESMWGNRPIAFQLDNESWVYPMRDDEGNDGGALACDDETLPVLSVED